jgi:hypothetical protein
MQSVLQPAKALQTVAPPCSGQSGGDQTSQVCSTAKSIQRRSRSACAADMSLVAYSSDEDAAPDDPAPLPPVHKEAFMNRPHAAGKRAQRPASGALTPQEASPVRDGDLSGSGGNVAAAGAAAAVLAAGFLLTKVLRRRLGGDGDRNAPRGQHSVAHVHDCTHLGRQGVCSHLDQVLVVHTKAANSSIWPEVDCARQTALHLPAFTCMVPSRSPSRSSCVAIKHFPICCCTDG